MGWWMDSSDMVLVLGVIFSGCTACLIAFCQNMRKSRCKKISCCCFSCDREMENAKKSAPMPTAAPARERSGSLDTNEPPSTRI